MSTWGLKTGGVTYTYALIIYVDMGIYNCKILFQLILILFLSLDLKIKSVLIELKVYAGPFVNKIILLGILPPKGVAANRKTD